MQPTSSAEVLNRLPAFHDNLPAGVIVYATDGRIVFANRQAQDLLGLVDDRLLGAATGTSGLAFVREDGSPLPPDELPFNIVLRTGCKLAELVAGVRVGASTRWLLCHAYPECDAAGVQQVVLFLTDCTALKAAQQSLEKSEERLRLVLKGSTDAPWDWDLVSGEVYYSERWWNMLGYRGDEGYDTPDGWQRLMHPDDAPTVAAYIDELLPSSREGFSLEFRLRHRDGHHVPVLVRGYVSRDAGGRAIRISGVNTDLTERKQLERHIHELAYCDHLTGLRNRRFLIEELDHVLTRGRRCGHYGALLYLDLDYFKQLNDTMGHDTGDQLLRQVALRLRRAVRQSDVLARLGGDEFVVVLEDLDTSLHGAASEVERVAVKLLAALALPYQFASSLFKSSASIGIALFDGAPTSVETLLKQADLAMYRAKADGRNGARFFDRGMQDAVERRADFEAAMVSGLSSGEFRLFCQPQFDRHGRLVGAEVLVRWQRGEDELIGPDHFIGFAEESGFILTLGDQVLRESCETLARWRDDPVLGGVKLAVNVSVHQMRDPGFPMVVERILQCTGAPANRLYLELTESVFAADMEEIGARMHVLRARGVFFSLDDFGTGYSSLAYLSRFPLAALKIDRSFVRDVGVARDATPIVEAIIALGHKLKLEIVAEGVEHEAQRKFLIRRGCSSLQGYLLGYPLPMAEFERVHRGKWSSRNGPAAPC